MGIGKLVKVPVRQLWTHEEYDFSKWLSLNIDDLNKELGFDLTVEETEKRVGRFELDLLALTPNGDRVIIENQLEQTDHDHLGKVITYMSNLDAKISIWITTKPREEHFKAISWLNENTIEDYSFYLIKLEAGKIGDSVPAPLFTVVSHPTLDGKRLAKDKGQLSKTKVERKEFWDTLIMKVKADKIALHSNNSATTENWLGSGAGLSGLTYAYYIWSNGSASVELTINCGEERNKVIFDQLLLHKEEIEGQMNVKFVWDRETGKMSRIKLLIDAYDWRNLTNRGELVDFMIQRMRELNKVFKPYIRRIKDESKTF